MEKNENETNGNSNNNNDQKIVLTDEQPEINYRGVKAMPFIIGLLT